MWEIFITKIYPTIAFIYESIRLINRFIMQTIPKLNNMLLYNYTSFKIKNTNTSEPSNTSSSSFY